MTIPTGRGVVWLDTPPFPEAARRALADDQLRANLRQATTTIRDNFVQPTVNAFGYTLTQFTLRWATTLHK